MVAVLGSSSDNLLFLYLIYSLYDPGRDIQPLQITFAIKKNLSVISRTMFKTDYTKHHLKATAQDNPGVIAL